MSGAWSACSRACGGGETHEAMYCVSVATNSRVEAVNCANVMPPMENKKACNTQVRAGVVVVCVWYVWFLARSPIMCDLFTCTSSGFGCLPQRSCLCLVDMYMCLYIA